MHRFVRYVPVVLIAVATVACAAAVAGAQTAPPSGGATTTTAPISTPPVGSGPGANTWSLSPTGKDPSQPSERTNFSHELAPGSSIDDSATVWNYSDQDRVFDVYVRDAFTTSAGGIDILTKEAPSKDIGLWVALSTQQVTVPAHRGVTVPFSITVPRTATPGDHDAGIVASIVTEGQSTAERRVVVDHRVGVRLYVRVTGELRPALTIEDLHSTYDGGTAPTSKGTVEVSYTVRNTGNVRLRSHQQLEITGLFGWSLADEALEDLPELLPGASITRTEHVDHVTPAVRLQTSVTQTPFAPKAAGADAAGAQPVSASSSQWVVPWLLLVVLGALFVAWRVVRRRRRAAGTSSAPRRGGPVPGAPAAATAVEEDVFDVDDLVVLDRLGGRDEQPSVPG